MTSRHSGTRHASEVSRSAFSTRSTGSGHSASHPASSQSLARRLLNPPSKTGAPLPPIIHVPATKDSDSSPNDISRLNDELYDFIALALRGYVNPWYTRLSPTDRELLPEISSAVVVVIQELDRRIRAADLHQVLLADLPALVTQHYSDFRLARTKLHSSYTSGHAQDSDPNVALAHIFHNIQSHLAVTPIGEVDDTYLRQAVDCVLKECLPPQDWGSEVERSIIREIIVRPVLGAAFSRLTQPWFLHSIFLALLGSPRPIEASSEPFFPLGDHLSSFILL